MDDEERIDILLNALTLDEKFRLMSGDTPFTTVPIPRLNIPAFGMTDGPHGIGYHSGNHFMGTYFPATIGLAATWDPELIEIYGEALGQEIRASGRHSVMGPGMNICRTPLNGRTFEYFSEDPFLNGQLVSPLVKGIQSQRIAACLKHFACNNTETWRKFSDAIVDERTLHEIYLRGFQIVIENADPWMIMGSYNKINGKYVYENPALMADEVCGRWGFRNFIVTDWGATFYLQDPAICIKSKLSLEMPYSVAYTVDRLKATFEAKQFTEDELNDCIRRLLSVMFKVGLFDPPESLPVGSRNTPEHQQIASRIVEEGAVLLKNSPDVLPIDLQQIHSIYIGGDMADFHHAPKLYGGSSAVVPIRYTTVLQSLKEKLGQAVRFVKDPRQADLAVVVTGWSHSYFQDNEGTDRHSLTLTKAQAARIRKVAQQNPHTVVILFGGGPCIMEDWIDQVAALLVVWQPHQEGGDAIAKLLIGEMSPSGKLPITYPRKLEDLPVHSTKFPPGRTYPRFRVNLIMMGQYEEFWTWHPPRDHRRTLELHYDEGIFVGYRHFDADLEPRFSFGFGLSYTTFEWNICELDQETGDEDTILHVSVGLKNVGNCAGAEVIQAYFHGPESQIARPWRELCGFARILLQPGEERQIVLSLALKDWRYYDTISHSWILEQGDYELFIGNSSRDFKFQFKVVV